MNPRPELRDRLNKVELGQGRHAVVEANLFDDLAVLELKDGRSGELHLATGVVGQRSCQEVTEGGPSVRTSTLPAADYVVAFRNQVGGAPEVEIRERLPEVSHEGLDDRLPE